jgi:eukaryotic-like serine/threonine-protein kinase
MNRLGDAPTDLLFGLIALHNDLIAPEVIPAALRAQVVKPTRTLAELLVIQGALTPVQRDLLESLSGEYISRHGGDAGKSLATLIATPSARERLDRLGDLGLTDDLGLTADLTPVDSLELAVSDDSEPRLDDPESTLPTPANVVVDSRPRIDGYEILEVLGAGGMGIVYKAHQERLDRFVALKMIRAGAGARPEDLVRFEAEAKAVAAIEHPNIIKIFDIGEQGGLPYFSLEFLAGGSLANKIGGKPQPVDEAARIVEVLARAISVAHQHRVIHRDLKPANVLIAADGTLKITDFGLVKRLESDSGQTRTGSILGTPSYMAPEQARGEGQTVGPAADQYSLGAILYELLTGRPPFQGTSVLDTLEMVRSKEPVPPSQLQPKTPRDMETICLKCLEKDPARRYPDVLALAEDLRSFQAGEPILARPVSDSERLWRWCLRNPRVASLSAAVALLLATLLVGSIVGFVIVSGQKHDLSVANADKDKANISLSKSNIALVASKKLADDRRIEAEKQRQEAERKTKLAVAAARAANEQNRIAVEAEVELVRLFDGKLKYVSEIQNEREQFLDKAFARLKDAARVMTDLRRDVEWAPENEGNNWRALARAHQALARVSLSRNKVEDAMREFQQMEEIVARLAAAAPDDLSLQVILLRTQRELGYVSMDRVGNSELARRYFRSALEKSRACLAKKPDLDVYKNELANSLGLLAGSESTLGHLKEARALYEEEIKVRKSLSPAQANDWEIRRELSGLYAKLAELNVRMGDRDAGQKLYDQCAELREQFVKERPDSWPAQNDLAQTYNHRGQMLFPQGSDPAGARTFHQKALAIYKKRSSAYASDFELRNVLALTLYFEATCALHSGDKDGAAAGYRECLKVCKDLANDPKAKKPKTLLMLAMARCGDPVGAAKIAEALVATPPKDEGLYVQAACGYALAAGAAGSDAVLVGGYTDKAIDCLVQAKKRGWADVVSLETDTDLEPIRNVRAFKALLEELRQPGGKRP